jgi:hypothetical protein
VFCNLAALTETWLFRGGSFPDPLKPALAGSGAGLGEGGYLQRISSDQDAVTVQRDGTTHRSGSGRCGGTVHTAFLYGGHVALLFVGATEGDTPPASSIQLPPGTEIQSEMKDCSSGGCWALFTVRPPDGRSPDDLAVYLGLTPQASIPGTLLDPRTIWLRRGATQGDELVIRADYWSSPRTS